MVYLEMNHVKKSFDDLEVLKDISFQVNQGEVVSIIGPSGHFKKNEGRRTYHRKPYLQSYTAYRGIL